MSRRTARPRSYPDPAPPPPAAAGGFVAPAWLRRFAPDAARELETNGGNPLPMDGRILVLVLVSCLLLAGYYYYGQRSVYEQNFAPWVNSTFPGAAEYSGMLSFWYRGLSSAFWRVLLPALVILLLFREPLREYGYRLPERGHGRPYLLLFLAMVPVLAAVSFLPGFQAYYPIYDRAGESLFHFVGYQLAYGIRFASVEAFFRGFLLFALYRRFGYHAVLLMTVPYCMIHFGKPLGEALGSIVAGLLLGFLALRGRSWLPGAMLHWAVAITMDLFALLQERLP